MFVLKKLKKQNVLEQEGLLFGLLEKEDASELSQMYYVDAVIIDTPINSMAEQLLNNIRKHYNPNLYLKPIFVVAHENLSKNFIDSCDGVTDVIQFQSIAKKTRFINERIGHLSQLQRFPSAETEYMYKTLQYMYSREIPLTPRPSRNSKINYFFPFISRLYNDIDTQQVFEVLNSASENNYLTTKLKDKVHLCGSCGSAHHTIRETCVCGSIDLKVEDLVHHFKCAYIGPISDFQQENSEEFCCPKCDQTLRHIGIDYDKPSHIYHCNACKNHFQEPSFTSLCIDCEEENDIHHLQEQPVNTYHLTTKGEHLIIKGLPISIKGSQMTDYDVIGVYTFDVFKHLVIQEKSRSKNSGALSCIGIVNIDDIQIKRMNDHDIQILRHELCLIIKSYLKDADIVSSKSLGNYYFIITDTNETELAKIQDLIESNISKLLTSNINSDPAIHVAITDLKVLDTNQF